MISHIEEEGMRTMTTTAIRAELPEELFNQAQDYVLEGWAADFNELLTDALRRYLESHSAKLTETFIREDVEWGLRGRD